MADAPGPSAPQPRRRGRPRAAERGVAVATWLDVATADRLSKIANARAQTVSTLVRILLVQALDQPDHR